MILLHGNGEPGPNAGPSLQLIARTHAAADFYSQHGDELKLNRICFFANDRYPNGDWAADEVWKLLSERGVSHASTHIVKEAGNTAGEVEAFLKYCSECRYDGQVALVTSRYHVRRSRYYFSKHGRSVIAHATPACGMRDVLWEPVKLLRDHFFGSHPQVEYPYLA
jgi:hypothetical protein